MVRLSPGLFQPIAAADVAAVVADVALAAPRNGIVEIAGPERAPFNEFVARYLKAVGDPRKVVRDPEARYYADNVRNVMGFPPLMAALLTLPVTILTFQLWPLNGGPARPRYR